ncbi:hypothetical protein M758_6G021400 [Ceratodon purpureus]|nr:hypothetical protein M758_6G021400 [Ceratodon purpureus]
MPACFQSTWCCVSSNLVWMAWFDGPDQPWVIDPSDGEHCARLHNLTGYQATSFDSNRSPTLRNRGEGEVFLDTLDCPVCAEKVHCRHSCRICKSRHHYLL